jgi:hypothetical protein
MLLGRVVQMYLAMCFLMLTRSPESLDNSQLGCPDSLASAYEYSQTSEALPRLLQR